MEMYLIIPQCYTLASTGPRVKVGQILLFHLDASIKTKLGLLSKSYLIGQLQQ